MTGLFVLGMLFAVFAVLIHVQLFRRVYLVALRDVVGRFAHRADESDE